MAIKPAQAFCRNHPERQATGICVRCGAPICPECTTKLEGINHCSACLDRRAAAGRKVRSGESPFWAVAGAVVSFAFFWVLFFAVGFLFMQF